MPQDQSFFLRELVNPANYRLRLLPHPEIAAARLLEISSRDRSSAMPPIPFDEADLLELATLLTQYVRSRRAILVQPNGEQQYCLPVPPAEEES